MDHSFDELFLRATASRPFPFQRTLATGNALPEILSVPTGSGKTAAVILSWLYRRRFHPDPKVRASTPRRLVYCLPMRVLVEQTRDVALTMLERLSFTPEEAVAVHVLMGGEVDRDWPRMPEKETILIGTQDMLLSRALNRGYGESRYRWPISYGLLNNDSLWVYDEVQLMGAGIGTSAQLDAFRAQWGTFGPTHTIWMSATITPELVTTVDRPRPERVLALSSKDLAEPRLRKRLDASKPLAFSGLHLDKDDGAYAEKLAAYVLERHKPATLSLVIANTVGRARAIYASFKGGAPKKGKVSAKNAPRPEVLLLHSRFRPADRAAIMEKLLSPVPPEGRIVVSTQVVEAGVDLSARFLCTEIAPWPSLVQRFGRCNRTGDIDDAEVAWIDIDSTSDRAEALARPYTVQELEAARSYLAGRKDAAPSALPGVNLPRPLTHLPRRRDVLELFDTTPDVSGTDIDVSRFVRETDDRSVQVFWRDPSAWGDRNRLRPPSRIPRAGREELCTAPVGEVRKFLEKCRRGGDRLNGWVWSVLDGEWRHVDLNGVRPGQVLLLRADLGGYSPEFGWAPDESGAVQEIVRSDLPPEEGADDDTETFQTGQWVPLRVHAQDAAAEARRIARALTDVLDGDMAVTIETAARWHDLGKAHQAFQHTLLSPLEESEKEARANEIWAKSPHRARHTARPKFRHELASALAVLAVDRVDPSRRDLVAYLVAAHHGRVRLSIRSIPGEKRPTESNRFALGVWEGDELPDVDLGDGVKAPASTLHLEVMEHGRCFNGDPSWTDRMLRLRDSLGPFRLAFLEALVIAADWRASERAARPALEGEEG